MQWPRQWPRAPSRTAAAKATKNASARRTARTGVAGRHCGRRGSAAVRAVGRHGTPSPRRGGRGGRADAPRDERRRARGQQPPRHRGCSRRRRCAAAASEPRGDCAYGRAERPQALEAVGDRLELSHHADPAWQHDLSSRRWQCCAARQKWGSQTSKQPVGSNRRPGFLVLVGACQLGAKWAGLQLILIHSVGSNRRTRWIPRPRQCIRDRNADEQRRLDDKRPARAAPLAPRRVLELGESRRQP